MTLLLFMLFAGRHVSGFRGCRPPSGFRQVIERCFPAIPHAGKAAVVSLAGWTLFIVLGLVVGIGYAVVILLNTASFEFAKPNRWVWGAIDATYHAVGLLIAAVILALMP